MKERIIWCSESVPARQGYGYYACSKPAKYDLDANGNPTKCGTHCAEAVKRRKIKQSEAYKQYTAQRDARYEIQKVEKQLESTLRRIADGHNDPRGLAQEVIGVLDYHRNTLAALVSSNEP